MLIPLELRRFPDRVTRKQADPQVVHGGDRRSWGIGSPSSAAIVCFLASASTATGIVVAAGISDRRDLMFYAINVAVVAIVAIPAVVAVDVLMRRQPR